MTTRRTVLEMLTGLALPAVVKGEAMIYRTLGSTGEKVSAIGLGGHHIGRPKDAAEGVRIIRTAIDRGITFRTIAGTTTTARANGEWEKLLKTGTARKCFS